MQWLANFLPAMRVRRLHTSPTLTNQTVGQHTIGTIAIAAVLCDTAGVQKETVMLALMEHDMAELYTGDIPAPAKIENPEMRVALYAIESRWERDNTRYTAELSVLEKQICKAADWLELMLHCAYERGLGNRHIEDVYWNIRDYILDSGVVRDVPGALDLFNHAEERWYGVGGN